MFKKTLLLLILAVMITSEVVHYHYHYSSPSTQKHHIFSLPCNNDYMCPLGHFCDFNKVSDFGGTCT